jgi:hypothetical protein
MQGPAATIAKLEKALETAQRARNRALFRLTGEQSDNRRLRDLLAAAKDRIAELKGRAKVAPDERIDAA